MSDICVIKLEIFEILSSLPKTVGPSSKAEAAEFRRRKWADFALLWPASAFKLPSHDIVWFNSISSDLIFCKKLLITLYFCLKLKKKFLNTNLLIFLIFRKTFVIFILLKSRVRLCLPRFLLRYLSARLQASKLVITQRNATSVSFQNLFRRECQTGAAKALPIPPEKQCVLYQDKLFCLWLCLYLILINFFKKNSGFLHFFLFQRFSNNF